MQGSFHSTSPPSDESHASAAGPHPSTPSPPVSSTSEQAHPSRQAGPVNTISSGAPSRLAASQSHPQQPSRLQACATPVPDGTGSSQTRAALGGLQRARPGEAAAAAGAAGSAQPASGKYGSRAANQVRPQKRRRQAPAQAPVKEPASAAAAFSTAMNAQEAVSAAFERADALSHALHDRVSSCSLPPLLLSSPCNTSRNCLAR